MKTVIKKLKLIITVVLCMVLAAPFSACQKEQTNLTDGITVVPDAAVEYSATTVSTAAAAVYGFLCQYHKLVANTVLSEKTEERYLSAAKKVQEITAAEKVAEEDYLKFFKRLKDDTEEYALAFKRVKEGNASKDEQTALKNAFNSVTALWGADAVASVIYELTLYRYDCQYADSMETYEFYKDGESEAQKLIADKAKEDAERAVEDKATLTNEVKKENFIPTVKLCFMLSEAFFGGGFNEGFVSSLSGQEALLILTEPDFSGVEISDKGWELLLSYTESAFTSSYRKSLVSRAVKSGDIKLLAAEMQTVIELVCSLQKRLDNEQAEYLVKGDGDGFIGACFNKFTDDDWAAFKRVTGVNISKDQYHQEATDYYGKEYVEYAASVTVYTFDELKNAVGGENFTDVLKGYFAGICPAFTYRGNE